MPEPIVRIHLPLEVSGGRLLDSNGDEVRHPLAFPKFISNTTVILAVELFDRELQPDLSWRLEPHPLDAGDTWSISGACSRSAIRSRCSPMIRPESICPETGRTAPTPILRPDG